MTKTPAQKTFTLGFWISLILFLAIWFYMLGARTLVPTDEGRYAEMAREMVATGDWVTPRLNGIKYFEKPPLQTWMNAITFALFGLGEWQARLWTGLSALLGIVLVGYTGARLAGKKTGITAAVILASSFWWAGLGHINTLDMGLSGMMTLALCAMLLAQRDQASANERRNWMLLCWTGMALATLSKGIIGIVIPGSILVLYTVFTFDWHIWQRLHLIKGLLLFFAITAPWFVLVAQANEEFLYFFFIHEHWERFTSKVHRRDGAWYYFIPLLVVGVFPWLGLLLQSIWKGARRSAQSVQPAAAFQANKLLVIWTLFIFCFFSASNSKLPSYILPIFPAMALLMAMYLERPRRHALVMTSVVMTLLGLGGLMVWCFAEQIPALHMHQDTIETALHRAYLPYFLVAALLMFFSGIAAWISVRQHQQRAVWILAWAGFLSGQLLLLGHEPWGRYIAGTQHLAAIQAELNPSTTIYAVGRYEQSLPFYLRRTTVLVEHPDELEFGLQQEPQLWIPKRAGFVTQWLDHQTRGVPALAIIHPDIYASFVEQKIPMRVVAQDPRRVIVSSQLFKQDKQESP